MTQEAVRQRLQLKANDPASETIARGVVDKHECAEFVLFVTSPYADLEYAMGPEPPRDPTAHHIHILVIEADQLQGRECIEFDVDHPEVHLATITKVGLSNAVGTLATEGRGWLWAFLTHGKLVVGDPVEWKDLCSSIHHGNEGCLEELFPQLHDLDPSFPVRSATRTSAGAE